MRRYSRIFFLTAITWALLLTRAAVFSQIEKTAARGAGAQSEKDKPRTDAEKTPNPSDKPRQQAGKPGNAANSQTVVVTASRIKEDKMSAGYSFTRIEADELSEQLAISPDLGNALAKKIPGLSLSNETFSNFGQTVRGRSPLILYDGVPITVSLLNTSNDLRSIDPNTVGRVQVIRSATSIYGFGAAGGLINFQSIEPQPESLQFISHGRVTFSTVHVDDSFKYNLSQTVSTKPGKLDVLANGSYYTSQLVYDAQGDAVPTAPLGQVPDYEQENYGGLLKLGYDFTKEERLSMLYNRYQVTAEQNYDNLPGRTGRQKSRLIPNNNKKPEDKAGPLTQFVYVDFRDRNFLGSVLETKLYYQDHFLRGPVWYNSFGLGDLQWDLQDTKAGHRLSFLFPVAGLLVRAGADSQTESTVQSAEDINKGSRFDRTPKVTTYTTAPFFHLEYPVLDTLTINGGVRLEAGQFVVDDYRVYRAVSGKGGRQTYFEPLLQTGLVYRPNKDLSVFTNFSQGLLTGEVARLYRILAEGSLQNGQSQNPDFDRVKLEPKKISSVELGSRWDDRKFVMEVVGFASTSRQGVTLTNTGSNTNPVYGTSVEPELIYGLETTADWQATQILKMGIIFSYSEGLKDSEDNGSYETALTVERIQPAKLISYIQLEFFKMWRNRLEALYSFSRKPFGKSTALGEGPVKSFYRLDFLSEWKPTDGYTIAVGIQNLTNNLYYTPMAQGYNVYDYYIQSPGTMVSVSAKAQF